MRRLDSRIRRSKATGKLALLLVLVLSAALAAVLVHGLRFEAETGRTDLLVPGILGLVLLLALDVFSIVLIRRQHHMLDEARSDLEALVKGEESAQGGNGTGKKEGEGERDEQ